MLSGAEWGGFNILTDVGRNLLKTAATGKQIQSAMNIR